MTDRNTMHDTLMALFLIASGALLLIFQDDSLVKLLALAMVGGSLWRR